jgi:predicted acyl esterase
MFTKAIIAAASISAAVAVGPQKNESRTWEEMLPCRDGTNLHTRIVMPREDNGGKYTTIIDRSPYGYGDLEWIPGN